MSRPLRALCLIAAGLAIYLVGPWIAALLVKLIGALMALAGVIELAAWAIRRGGNRGV